MTFVRKSELTKATWDEIDFEEALWTIPAGRMKKRTPHVVPLSSQALDILIGLKTLAGSSEFVLPSRYDSTKPMSSATFNRFFRQLSEAAEKQGKHLPPFGPHDLRRTASTLLHEAGFASDWIEKLITPSIGTVFTSASRLTAQFHSVGTSGWVADPVGGAQSITVNTP